jgi:uncharacterized membrane protein YeaQ/YmgE (transglycosylase-associated protein family)
MLNPPDVEISKPRAMRKVPYLRRRTVRGGTNPMLSRCARAWPQASRQWKGIMGIIWTIIIGFIAGVIAKFIMPGRNEPSGFILTTILGIVGAFVATYLGQALGWYRPGEGAGLIGAVVGAIVVLFIWGVFTRQRA